MLGLAALLLISLLGIYFFLGIVAQLRIVSGVSRASTLERNYLRAEIERVLEARRSDKAKHEFSWNGLRKFRVAKKVQENSDIASFYFVPHDGKPLPPFSPGQYLTFELNIPDPANPAVHKQVVRCYSLSDSPDHKDYYRITVKRVPAPRDKPGVPPGLVSNYWHDHVKEGDIVDIKAPSGQFYLDLSKQTPIVLIGGGVGITPVLSMLNAVIASGLKRETWFFLGIRNRAEHIMKEHLEKVALGNSHVHLNICYSDPSDKDVKGSDYHHAERVSVDLFKRLLPSNNYQFLICGPPPMMNQLTQDLAAWGVPEKSILFEAFGPASVKKPKPPDASASGAEAVPAQAIQLNFAKSGKVLPWKAGCASILDLALENGLNLSYGCRAGNCGTCVTAVKSGEVSYTSEPGARPESGSCLTCVSVPKSNLTLDA